MSDNDDGGVRPEISRRIRSIVGGSRNVDDDPPAEENAAEPAPAPARAPSPPAQASASGDGDGKALVVGHEIVLSGSINACDKLVVDGRVEADLKASWWWTAGSRPT
jgi:hypothetical protein